MNFALLVLNDFLDIPHAGAEFAEGAPRMLQKAFALGRQFHASRGSMKHGNAELPFELLDLCRNGRLRPPQHLRRQPETSTIGHGHKCLELLDGDGPKIDLLHWIIAHNFLIDRLKTRTIVCLQQTTKSKAVGEDMTLTLKEHRPAVRAFRGPRKAVGGYVTVPSRPLSAVRSTATVN